MNGISGGIHLIFRALHYIPKTFLSFLFLGIICLNSLGQNSVLQVDSVNSKRLTTVLVTEGILYAGTMVSLNEVWYKDYPRSSFHHFNDNAEWLQMDKVGHAFTAYYVGLVGMDAMRWAGVDDVKSRWWGGGLGWIFLSSVEVLDGFSAEWGFSSGDILSNSIGMGALVAQDAFWHEQRVVFKYSFKESPYAKYRPATLGDGFREELLKDYNGQTYWLSANVHSFLPEQSKFPKWLSLGLGYGVDGVISARSDYAIVDGGSIRLFEQERQFYLGPDIDLWRIPTKKKGLKTAFKVLGFIKLPLPALVMQNGNLRMQYFSF